MTTKLMMLQRLIREIRFIRAILGSDDFWPSLY